MSLTLAIAMNAIVGAGIIGLLAYAMTRPTRLTPHVPAVVLEAEQRLETALADHRRSGRRVARPATRRIRTVAAARS
jgi:hypothetical protein